MYAPTVDTGTVHAVRLAFQRARSVGQNWASRQHVGRIDGSNVYRNEARLDRDIFRDKRAPGATKVHAMVLVDTSGSMTAPLRPLTKEEDAVLTEAARAYRESRYTAPPPVSPVKKRIEAATDVVATLTEAFQSIPSVRLDVWTHNAPFASRDTSDLQMVEVIRNGKGKANLAYLPQVAQSAGNGDGYAIKWAANKLVKESRYDEVPLLIVVSDGLPSWLASNRDASIGAQARTQQEGDGIEMVFNVVNEARDRGIRVVSVGIAPDMSAENQQDMYGKGNVIPFDAMSERAWGDLAIAFGTVLGDTLGRAIRAKASGRRR